MRTQTFISSMVGVVAAMALAGRANATVVSFVDSFTTSFATDEITNGRDTSITSTVPTTGSNACLFNTRDIYCEFNGSRASSSGTGSASINIGNKMRSMADLTYYNSDYSTSCDLSSTTGFSVNVESWSKPVPSIVFTLWFHDSSGSLAESKVIVLGNGLVNFSRASSVVKSGGPINWSAIMNVELRMDTTATQTGSDPLSFTISNFTTTVPAPGAAALVGLAGILAGRRRRN